MAEEIKTEVEPHPDLRKARRGGVRMVTQLLNSTEPLLLLQAISALQEMMNMAEHDESFAGMDGYNLATNIAIDKNNSAELKNKALTFLSALPTPAKMDVDATKLDALVELVNVTQDEETRKLLYSGTAKMATYEDWSSGLTLRANFLQTILSKIKEAPKANHHLIHILAALSAVDDVASLEPEEASVIATAFMECDNEERQSLLAPITQLVGVLGRKLSLTSAGGVISSFLSSNNPQTRANASKLLQIIAEHDRKTIAGSLPFVISLLSKPGFEELSLELLRKFSVYAAVTVVMMEKGAIKALLALLKSPSATPQVKEEAQAVLKRIVEEPDNKVKIVSEGQLSDILNSLDKESGEEIISALSFEAFCERGDLPISIAKTLLESGADPSVNDNISIVYAATNGSAELVSLLLQDKRVNPAANNNAAIRRAAAKDRLSVVQLLLKDPRVDPSASGNSPILSACENGHYAVFKALLQDSRVDVQLSVLVEAAIKGGKMDIFQELLQKPDFVTTLQETGTDILALAIQWHRREIAELMLVTDTLQPLIDPSNHENQAIQWAARSGFSELVDLLLYDNRVDPTANDNNAIKQAVFNNHKAVVELLLKDRRPDPSIEENLLLRHACKNGSQEISRLLLDDPSVDPSAKENEAIREASLAGYETIVDDLLSHDLVDASDCKNQALINAVKSGHVGIMRMLCSDKRVDPSCRYNAPLKIACARGDMTMTEILLNDERVDPSAGDFELVKKVFMDDTIQDKDALWRKFAVQFAINHNHPKVVTIIETDPRASPVFLWNYAVNNKNVDFVKLLLNDERIKDVYIKNAFSVASKNGDFDIMELLLQADNCDISLKEVGKSISTGFSMMRKKVGQVEGYVEELLGNQEKMQKKLDAIIDLLLDKEDREQ